MKTLAAIPFYFCLFVMLLLLSSCGTFHKVQTSQHSIIDSTSSSHYDSSVKKGIDTTKASTFISSDGDSVAVELYNNPITLDPKSISPTGWLNHNLRESFSDNMPWEDSLGYVHFYDQKVFSVSYDPETHTVTSNQPIKKAVFKTDSEVAYSNFTGGIDTTLIQVKQSRYHSCKRKYPGKK
jgi:hypothetical protein